ncbi:MAG: ATP-binding protein [Gammaproteobacteria bacterium]|nr:ATP-binding protein [Gammaproteobacteria bacterium]
MLKRVLANKIRQFSAQFPIVALTGPRQSGKTTLSKCLFPQLPYVSLEDPDTRYYASQDPRGFLNQYRNGAIFDEAQRVPHLFSYLQTHVDELNQPGRFILTGSQNFLLLDSINQSLAGRVAITKLLPLSLKELIINQVSLVSPEDCIFKGGYPKLYAQTNLLPTDWYPHYIQTYLERDVRQIKNILDLSQFQLFLKMCASRIGQLLNLSALASECGITHNTAKAWLSLLEASYIVFLLRPHHKNFSKRLVKMPKLYFYDTGVACSLLGIEKSEQLITHFSKGHLFENLIILELLKEKFNSGRENNLYFWRDNHGHEIDCIIDHGSLDAIEIKSGKTINPDFFTNLIYWQKLSPENKQVSLVYGGDLARKQHDIDVMGWINITDP